MPRMIQLRNVPDALHRQLKARAALAEYPTPEQMRERLRSRDAYAGRVAAADLVRAERESR